MPYSPRPGVVSTQTIKLTLEARFLLGLGQRQLGDLLGVSKRTVQRWDANQSHPSSVELAKLATVVDPHHGELAAKLAAEAGTTLAKLGLVRPEPAGAPSASPPALRHLTDVVVCAAAAALNAPPPAVRPLLLAAFRRAREVGLRVEDVEKALSDAIEGPSPPKGRSRPR
jgi:transcriptional regulator with XRE-family HTH domain